MLSLPQFSNMVVHNAILLEMVLPAIAKVRTCYCNVKIIWLFLCSNTL